MHNKKCSIGIYDSGLGGITVLKELIKILPNEDIIYYGDSKNAPYGSKTAEEVKSLSNKIVDFLLKKECKIIVVACNTSSVASIDFLREKFKNIDFMGIINCGATSAISASDNHNYAILATEFTANSRAYTKEIQKNY